VAAEEMAIRTVGFNWVAAPVWRTLADCRPHERRVSRRARRASVATFDVLSGNLAIC
jgi:hypothetical protein